MVSIEFRVPAFNYYVSPSPTSAPPAIADAGGRHLPMSQVIHFVFPRTFVLDSIRFLGESHLPRELVPITGILRFLDPVEVYSFHNS